MPITSHVESRLLVISIRGTLPAEDLLSGFAAAIDAPRLTGSVYLLVDVSDSETLPPPELLRGIASLLTERREKIEPRIAVLVGNTVRFGLARQLGAWLELEGIDLRPFHDRSDAVAWLQVDP